MKIYSISIENFRGIKHLECKLAFPVTVLAGENGAGKSSVLDSVSILLSWFIVEFQGHVKRKTEGQYIRPVDIYNDYDSVAIGLAGSVGGKLISHTIKSHRNKLNKQSHRIDGHGMVNFMLRVALRNASNHMLPLIVHYPVNRSVAKIPLQIDHPLDLMDPMMAFDGAVDASVNFHSFFTWFRQREDLEQETIREMWDRLSSSESTTADNFVHDPQLQAVRQAIERFTQLTGLRVRRSPLHMEIKKEGKTLWIDQLSNGEKCLLSMVGDIARRLAILAGTNSNPLEGHGIVLIDEIDLHLHPAWQREIIPKLVQTFPNCQFIVSTHSPQVLSDVAPEAVFLLRQKEGNVTVEHPEESFGQTSDRILEDIMGVSARPQEIKEALRKLFYLISTNDLDGAKEQVNQLQNKIGRDPDLVRASTLIQRKEVLGR